MNRKLIMLVTGALAIGLLAAGCGGSDDESDDTAGSGTGTDVATSLTKEEFLKEGNAICVQGNAAIAEEQAQLGADPTLDQLEQFAADTLVPSIQEQVDGLDDLPAPEGDEDQIDAIVEAGQTGIDETAADPASIAQGGNQFAEANQLLVAYGLTECAG